MSEIPTPGLRVMHVFGGRVRSGVESTVLTLADGQRNLGDQVILVPLVESAFTEEIRDLGHTVESLGKKRHYDLLSIPRLCRMIKRHNPDILQSWEVNGMFYACPAGRLVGVRRQVAYFQTTTKDMLKDVYRWEFLRTLSYKYQVWLTRWCRRVIAASPALREGLLREGVPPDKVAFIPNSVDVDVYDRARTVRESMRAELQLPPETTVIGTVARLDPIKNLPMLLDTVRQLVDGANGVRLLIVGDGPQRPLLERKAQELGIAGHVSFTGWRDDIPRLMAALDVYAITSTSEGTPVSVLEAMASGKPVVATDVGGLKELVRHDQTGLLVPSNDADAMTRAIRSLSVDRDLARRFGQAGRRLVGQEFGADTLVKKVRNVYAELLREDIGCGNNRGGS